MSEVHEAGQPWEEFLEHLDSEHWGSRNPAFIPADEPLPEELEGYDAYECPCGGTGTQEHLNDATLADRPDLRKRTCPYCSGFGSIYILHGFPKPRYAGKPISWPLPEEAEFEPTPEGVVYLNAHKFLEAKTSLATAQAILDRILEKVKRDGPNA